MPPAAAAIAAGVAASFTGVTILGVTYTGLAAGLIVGIGSFAMSALQSALTPKPKAASFKSFSSDASGQNEQILQPLVTRKIGYGEIRRSGGVLFASSSSNNTYLHLVIELGWGEINKIGEVWLDDTSIPPDYLDASGNVVSGKYAGVVRIKKYLGTAAQNVGADLMAECPEVGNTDKFSGIPCVWLRYTKNRDVFPAGRPDFSAWIEGNKILDPRDDVTRWTPNSILQTRDYLKSDLYGFQCNDAEIDDDQIAAAANVCDEIVATEAVTAEVLSVNTTSNLITLTGYTLLPFARGDRVTVTSTGSLPGGLSGGTDYFVIPYQRKGTLRIALAADLTDAIDGVAVDITSAGSGTIDVIKNGEPRYWGGGQVDTDAELGNNLANILTGCLGSVIPTGGTMQVLPAAYRSPSITFDESHLRAPIRVRPRVSFRDLFNTVKGVYISPFNGGTPTDYPAYVNTAHKTHDGEEKISDLDLPFVQVPTRATRIAKIKEQIHRQELVVEYPMNPHGMRVKAGDTVMINNTRMGWSAKVFEVKQWTPVFEQGQNGAMLLGIDLLLQETAAAVYDWSSSEEGAVDIAPNTNLPDPFSVTVPIGFSLDSIPVFTQAGDKTYKITASWDQHSDALVVNNGRMEIQIKKSTDSIWRDFPPVDGAATETDLFQASLGTLYDVKIRAVNSLGVPSAWVAITSFLVGSSVITNTEDWENETLARDTQDWEIDTLTSEDWEA